MAHVLPRPRLVQTVQQSSAEFIELINLCIPDDEYKLFRGKAEKTRREGEGACSGLLKLHLCSRVCRSLSVGQRALCLI